MLLVIPQLSPRVFGRQPSSQSRGGLGLPSSFGVALPGFSGPYGAPSPVKTSPKIEGPTPTLILAIRGALTRRNTFSCLFNAVVIGGKR